MGHAARHGLSAIALTDHDTLEGCERAAAACHNAGLEFLPAAELTAEFNDHELHLLAYGVDAHDPDLLAAMDRFQAVRQRRIHDMVARLNRLNILLQAETVFALANCRSPGRPHVARALVEGGFCSSADDAFDRFLKRDRPAWVPKYKICAHSAIELIHQAGGLAVLAHPGLSRIDALIPQLVDGGLDGLECFHPKHAPAATEHYLQRAVDLDLLITGGSDCHGLAKDKPLIGTVKLPYAFVAQLKTRAAARRSRLQRQGTRGALPHAALRAAH